MAGKKCQEHLTMLKLRDGIFLGDRPTAADDYRKQLKCLYPPEASEPGIVVLVGDLSVKRCNVR